MPDATDTPHGPAPEADLAAEYAAVDWAATSLGAREHWSPTLRATVDMALNTRFPITLIWGPDFTMIYNSAYTQLIGDKHPGALGRPCAEVFPEIWDQIGPMMHGVRDTRTATWVEDTPLILERHGFPEETYFTFSYSAVADADGTIEGLIDITAETTEQVIDRRRMRLLSSLGAALTGLTTASEVCATTVAVLAAAAGDVVGVEIRHPDLATVAAGCPTAAPPAPAPAELELVGEGDAPTHRDGRTGRTAWLRLPIADSSDAAPALLGIALSPHLAPDKVYLDFVRLAGTALAQALDRIAASDAERRAAQAERAMAVALQESLLTAPVQTDRVEIAVRYRAAVEQVRVGGDWYDSFLLPDGTLVAAVGDVSGHDRDAAAAMAQIRNLLRGVAFTSPAMPAQTLAGLEGAMRGLGVSAFASAVLAQIECADDGCILRWSNAGHPPPVLLDAAGARLLDDDPDVLLGVRSTTTRTEHRADLAPGSTLVLYTDGLVEQRYVPIEQGLAALVEALDGRQELGAEAICDHLLERFGGTGDDDVALLVLRVR